MCVCSRTLLIFNQKHRLNKSDGLPTSALGTNWCTLDYISNNHIITALPRKGSPPVSLTRMHIQYICSLLSVMNGCLVDPVVSLHSSCFLGETPHLTPQTGTEQRSSDARIHGLILLRGDLSLFPPSCQLVPRSAERELTPPGTVECLGSLMASENRVQQAVVSFVYSLFNTLTGHDTASQTEGK